MSSFSVRHYLDHNATSPLRPEALQAMREQLAAQHGNPSSLHQEGRAARAAVEEGRAGVASLVGCRTAEVVLTSGGSEAIAAAIRGVSDRAPEDRRRILVSSTEHSAVLESARAAARRGMLVVEVPCGREGRVDLQRFKMQMGADAALAVLHWANNETGVLQPVDELAQACRAAGVPILIDAVQAAGKLPIDFPATRADMLAISSHKIGGPQGAGALIVREGIRLAPLIAGGAQEKRRRGGTEAVAAIAGFGAAARAARQEIEEDSRTLLRHRARIETRLRELEPRIRFHGEGAPRLPNTVNFSIPGVAGETLVIALDLAGFAVSTGSACASGAVEPSHVLRAMGLDDQEARGAVRISLGWSTSRQDVEAFLEVFPGILRQVREALETGD